MKIGRLVEAALSSLGSGAVIRMVAPETRWAPWIVGLLLLAMFLPVHIGVWGRFPVWYHLAFLVPLGPLVPLGASLLRKRPFQRATSPV